MTGIPLGTWRIDGMTITIEQGRKSDRDRRVWVSSPGGGRCLITLATLGAIVGLWYRNEDVLYPPPERQGGQMVLDFLRECCETDLKTACAIYLADRPAPRIEWKGQS